MKFKMMLIIIILLCQSLFAQYEKVAVGKIDKHFENILNEQVLINIINSIENTFESTLGQNIFDYSFDGKPINIIYMKPSTTKQTINKGLKTLENKKNKIGKLKEYFDSKQDYISTTKNKLTQINTTINDDILRLNRYVKNFNNQKITSKEQYNKEIAYIKKEEKKIKSKQNKFEQQQTKFKTFLHQYNQKTSLHNSLVNQYNKLQRKLERLSKGTQEIKGVAIGYKETINQTYYKDGEKYQKTTSNNYMEKIEIYGFDSLEELKAILAHEIAHLVGVGHVEKPYSLMNPTLQKNQIIQLELTPTDIYEFRKIF